MKNLKKMKVNKRSSIKDVLQAIVNGGARIALMVDNKDRLIGTITDGDIRRHLLRGYNINDTIETIPLKKPTIAHINDPEDKVLNKALSKGILQVPIIDKNKKIIDLHVVDKLLKLREKPNKVFLMVGGIGTRLMPYTKSIPKPMLKVGDVPILETIIKNFVKSGFVNIVMCVNYKSKVIIDYFDNGSKFGAKIDYVIEKKKMGTAGALSFFKKKISEPFFVMNGDLLTNLDFENLLNFHKDHHSIATMCVREYKVKLPFGVINLDKERILSLEEKPIHKFFVNSGIYMLNPGCIKLIPNSYYDMTTLFQNMIKKKKNIASFPLQEHWIDIGSLSEFERAQKEYFKIF